MRFLLDTNIVSDPVKPAPSPALKAWMAEQDVETLFISAMTIAEIWRGVLRAPRGRRRDALLAWFEGPAGPRQWFAGRVLAFDEEAGLAWARLMAEADDAGRPRSPIDAIIAAIAAANGCVLVTDNERHFPGVETLNPMREDRAP